MTKTLRCLHNNTASRAETPFGVMFHHFSDGYRHPPIEGALSIAEFDRILANPGLFEFLPAAEWLERFELGTLQENELCITFDDALLSQFELAEPVLKRHGLTAFWFVYSSVCNGEIPLLEVHRYFRNTAFPTMSCFYDEYFKAARKYADLDIAVIQRQDEARVYMLEFSIYNENDRLFRYVRDCVLTSHQNNQIMSILMSAYEFDPKSISDKLWLKDDHIKQLSDDDHIVGLHSYSHPTNLSMHSASSQRDEYTKNANHLANIIGHVPDVMAHPSNSYDNVTLEILKELDVKYGFRSNAAIKNPSKFELPRVDHTIFARSL